MFVGSGIRRAVAGRTSQFKAAANARRFSKKAATPEPRAAVRPTKAMVIAEVKEVGKLMVGGLLLTAGLIASGGFVIETTKSFNPLTPPGFLLEIPGPEGEQVQVHVQRKGSGDVTVLFDGGVGETSFDWDKVADQVAKFATVVSVDRPGLGFSAPGAQPRTSTQIAQEYKEILTKLNVTGKVILVAHGAGGYNMRELAEELKQSAAASSPKCEGLVLVDALQENLRGELESVSESVQKSLTAMDENGETVLLLSRIGLIRLISLVQHSKSVAKYSPFALPYVEHFSPSPAHRTGALHENQGIPKTEQRFRDSAASKYPFEFPCVVLSHGKSGMFDSMKMEPGVTPDTLTALERKWLEAQTKLAQTVSMRSVHLVVKDAGHCIHHEKPEEVTKAVRAIVEEINGDTDKHSGLMSLSRET
ncbi:Epsin-1, required for endocytosis and actin patch assembly [Phytophthora boehmeriae]|uniref:Epsin-1, required for endocytosis and actin patch assembly n=1 Tax=Phytophthora boehmeriae TaxID=109152 RepID=A0A8T1W5Q3_9STRA|nr:Epsin-1, required for endocytosis and actin patch assembly [Phytophthora boehmeriae]